MELKAPAYKPWIHHPNSSSSSLVASGMQIGVPLPPRSAELYSNKALPRIPTPKSSIRESFEDSVNQELDSRCEPQTSPLMRNAPLDRVKDRLIQPSASSNNTNTSSAASLHKGSSRKIRQLTGLDLNVGENIPVNDDIDDDDESDYLIYPHSRRASSSSDSVYSQAGTGSGVSESAPHPPEKSPEQVQQIERAARPTNIIHTPHNTQTATSNSNLFSQDSPNASQNSPSNQCEMLQYALNHPPISIFETDEPKSLIPRPLRILTKKKATPAQSPSPSSKFSQLAEVWSLGIKGLISPTSSTSVSTSAGTRASTPVSPMGSMASDHITLPPLPNAPTPARTSKQRFETVHPLKSPFPFADENKDTVSREERRRSLIGIIMGWSEAMLPGKKTGEAERRRVSLRGKIMLVGVPDQSPGMCSSA